MLILQGKLLHSLYQQRGWEKVTCSEDYKKVDYGSGKSQENIVGYVPLQEAIGEPMTERELELIHDYRRLTSEGQKIISANIKLIVGNYDCSRDIQKNREEDVG